MTEDQDSIVAKAVRGIVEKQVKVTKETLELPAGIVWPFARNNIMFVRRYYAPLYEAVLNKCQPISTKEMLAGEMDARHIVTGQPGIGKSVFGCVWVEFVNLG